jgi:hypothetical protein
MKHRIMTGTVLLLALLVLLYIATAPFMTNVLVRQGRSLAAYRPVLAFNRWAMDRPALARALQSYHGLWRSTVVIPAD